MRDPVQLLEETDASPEALDLDRVHRRIGRRQRRRRQIGALTVVGLAGALMTAVAVTAGVTPPVDLVIDPAPSATAAPTDPPSISLRFDPANIPLLTFHAWPDVPSQSVVDAARDSTYSAARFTGLGELPLADRLTVHAARGGQDHFVVASSPGLAPRDPRRSFCQVIDFVGPSPLCGGPWSELLVFDAERMEVVAATGLPGIAAPSTIGGRFFGGPGGASAWIDFEPPFSQPMIQALHGTSPNFSLERMPGVEIVDLLDLPPRQAPPLAFDLSAFNVGEILVGDRDLRVDVNGVVWRLGDSGPHLHGRVDLERATPAAVVEVGLHVVVLSNDGWWSSRPVTDAEVGRLDVTPADRELVDRVRAFVLATASSDEVLDIGVGDLRDQLLAIAGDLPWADDVGIGRDARLLGMVPSGGFRTGNDVSMSDPLLDDVARPLRALLDPSPIRIDADGSTNCLGNPVRSSEWGYSLTRARLEGFDDARVITVQPFAVESCQQWFGVEIYVSDGEIVAVADPARER